MKIRTNSLTLLLALSFQLLNTTLKAEEIALTHPIGTTEGKANITNESTRFYNIDRSTENGRAGLTLAKELSTNTNINKPIDLQAILDALDSLIIANRGAEADNLAAAMAGSSVTAIGSAMMSDVERQMKTNRLRAAALRGNSGVGAWISVEGNDSTLHNDASQMGHSFSNYGGSLGFDFSFGKHLQLGVSFTTLYGDLNTDSIDRASGAMDSNYLSIYGQVENGLWRHRFGASAGWGKADITRYVFHEGVGYQSDGISNTYASAAFYELGYHLDPNWTLLGSFTMQHSNVDAYSETGSGAGLNVGAQSSSWKTLGIGIENHILYGGGEYNPSLHSRILFKTYIGDRGSTASVQFQAGGESAMLKGTEAGAFGVEIGTGYRLPFGEKGGVLFIDASLELREDLTDVNATVGYHFTF